MTNRSRDPASWALRSFICGFPVGWIVESFLTGGDYGYHTGALLGGIIGGMLAACLGAAEARALNGNQMHDKQSEAKNAPSDQPP
jgi:hypothetical protein